MRWGMKLKLNLSKRENNMNNKEFGKREIVLTIVGGVSIALAILMPFMSNTEIPTLIGSIILLVGIAVYCFWSAYYNTERKDKVKADSQFKNCVKFGNKELHFDTQSKTFEIIDRKKNEKSQIYKFSDIVKYEVIENNESKVNYSIGAGLIGDWLFGTAGAIACMVNSATTSNLCNELKLHIHLKSFASPMLEFEYIKSSAERNSKKYKRAFSQIKQNCALLDNMIMSKNKKIKQEPIEA